MRAVYEENCKRKTEENEEKLRLLYENEMRKFISIRRMEMRKIILGAKRDIIRELILKVKERFRSDNDLYRRFIEKGVAAGVITGSEELVISQEDRDIFNGEFIENLNVIAGKITGSECELHLADNFENTGGGFHLREGKVNFNVTVDTAVDSFADENEPEIGAILFGGYGE